MLCLRHFERPQDHPTGRIGANKIVRLISAGMERLHIPTGLDEGVKKL